MSNIEISIQKGNYNSAQQTLIDIWEKKCRMFQSTGLDTGYVTFTNRRPKRPKTDNRRIAGLKAECISYLNDDRELVKMSNDNFLLLMSKMGINVNLAEQR